MKRPAYRNSFEPSQSAEQRNKDKQDNRDRDGDADDQARRGENTVIGAEHGRTQPADPLDRVALTCRRNRLMLVRSVSNDRHSASSSRGSFAPAP